MDAQSLREQAYAVLSTHSLTADEVAERLGVHLLSIRPRVTELYKADRIHKTGERRPNRVSGVMASVWRAL